MKLGGTVKLLPPGKKEKRLPRGENPRHQGENVEAPTTEESGLAASRDRRTHWKRWGSYLSDRQWGTVREDYSADGSAWESFPHHHAPSRAYRWGEDGLMGVSDRRQTLCFAVFATPVRTLPRASFVAGDAGALDALRKALGLPTP